MIIPTDDEIVQKAKELFPYHEKDNESRIGKLSSKRRRFIQGAQWMRGIIKERNSHDS